jgi:hypothetical protein
VPEQRVVRRSHGSAFVGHGLAPPPPSATRAPPVTHPWRRREGDERSATAERARRAWATGPLARLSNTAWSGGALPYDLSAIGTQPGCFLQVSTDATLFPGVGTSLPWSLTIPNVPAYVGTQFCVQGFNFGQGTFPTNWARRARRPRDLF